LLPDREHPKAIASQRSRDAQRKACEGASAKHEQFGSSNLPVPTILYLAQTQSMQPELTDVS
jgi:hypothetical protein